MIRIEPTADSQGHLRSAPCLIGHVWFTCGRVRRPTEPVNPECSVEYCHAYALARRQRPLTFRAKPGTSLLGS
jgi:hypothetical protein